MRRSIKTLLIILPIIMSFISIQTVLADDFTVTGEIIEADRELSTIVIVPDEGGDWITIIGFPFHNLEIQLDDILVPLDPDEDGITIEAGDCVTVEYSEKELASGEVVNKWESLSAYCEECTVTEPCFEDEDGMTREPGQNRPKPPSWTGPGTPQGPPPGKPQGPPPGKPQGPPPGKP